MKKIYYFLVFILAVTTLSACNPLDKTYKQVGDLPVPVTAFSLTLTAADYGKLPSGHAAKTALYFKAIDTAKVDIPIILASKYPAIPKKSSVLVTYAITPTTIKLADSTNINTAATLNTTPVNDYIFPGNTFSSLSAAGVLNYLAYKYPTPAANELHVLTYLYFESGKTAGSGTLTTDAFLYLNGIWTKIYRVSDAQYATTGNGVNKWFVAGDAANLVSYFNTFLKADPTVMLTAKFGDVKYVNYRYTTNYQRVLPLTFDGTNWVTTSTPLSLSFVKTDAGWVADNTVTYKLVSADYTYIANIPGVGSDAAIANLKSFGNFNLLNGATVWTDDQINTGLITLFKSKFTTAVAGQKFVITYAAYNGANIIVTKTFKYDGATFVYMP